MKSETIEIKGVHKEVIVNGRSTVVLVKWFFADGKVQIHEILDGNTDVLASVRLTDRVRIIRELYRAYHPDQLRRVI